MNSRVAAAMEGAPDAGSATQPGEIEYLASFCLEAIDLQLPGTASPQQPQNEPLRGAVGTQGEFGPDWPLVEKEIR